MNTRNNKWSESCGDITRQRNTSFDKWFRSGGSRHSKSVQERSSECGEWLEKRRNERLLFVPQTIAAESSKDAGSKNCWLAEDSF